MTADIERRLDAAGVTIEPSTDSLTDRLRRRLLAHCVGRPAAVQWPHRVLHDAEQQLGIMQAEIDVANARATKADAENAALRVQFGVVE